MRSSRSTSHAAWCPPARPPTHIVGMESTRHNYLLLGLAVFQFPFIAWLARLP